MISAFEVLSNMIKTISDITDRLMELQSKSRKMASEQQGSSESSGSTTNNNVFVGSAAELQKMLNQQQQ